jgi:hypothetical protein
LEIEPPSLVAGHQSTTENNETIYAFLQTHLKNPGSPKTEQVEMPTNEEMRVTSERARQMWSSSPLSSRPKAPAK